MPTRSMTSLGSALPNRVPKYLTLDGAVTGGAVEVRMAAEQQVPTVEAVAGPSPVLARATRTAGISASGEPSCFGPS